MNDLSLRKTILEELEFQPDIDAANIGVAVENGAVTLTGHFSEPSCPASSQAPDAPAPGHRLQRGTERNHSHTTGLRAHLH